MYCPEVGYTDSLTASVVESVAPPSADVSVKSVMSALVRTGHSTPSVWVEPLEPSTGPAVAAAPAFFLL